MTKTFQCYYCHGVFTRKHSSQKFCCDSHRYKYHNWHNPRGYYAHLSDDDLVYRSGYDEDDAHIFSSEGLGQS